MTICGTQSIIQIKGGAKEREDGKYNISVQERVQSWSMRLLRLSPVPKIGMTFSAETGIKKREKKHAFMILQAWRHKSKDQISFL